MTPEELESAVRDDNETALSRLGSSKALYAATGGDLDADTVLRAAADAEHTAATTFADWTDTEPTDAAREVFARVAAGERDHADAVRALLDDYDPVDDPSGIQAALRDLDETVARAGGLLGRIVATERSKTQLAGFFVGQADPQTADLFRDLKADLDDQREALYVLLADVCETDADWDAAHAAATDAIQAAYDDYTDRLEDMGVNPKPVC
jgi:rubrerythrin